MRKNKILLLIFLFTSYQFFAQDSIALSYENYISWVQKNHPIIKISDWEKNIAQNNILKAKALLDPNISAKIGEKKIDNTLYYTQKNIELNLPTWYGIDFNIGTNDLAGNKLNNEETKGVLNHVGISIPLARDLVYNKRRTAIQQSKNFSKMTFYEQEMLKNEILLEANFSFWEWVKNYEILELNKKVLDLNKKRYQLVKKSFELGERPAIDTVEAFTQLQSFEAKTIESQNKFNISTIELSQFLWKENGENYNLPLFTKPSEQLNTQFTQDYFIITEKLLQNIDAQYALNYYFEKSKSLELERKLKWQNFLPKINFNYNLYNKEFKNQDILPLFDNNYQYGIKLELPIFMREARADYQNIKLKILQNNENIKFKNQELKTKIQTYNAEMGNFLSLTQNNESLIENYKRLLKAEEIKFSNGESSLFLINSRENKLLETQEKFLELKAKTIKTYFKLNWLENNTLKQ